jgi:hypothetical protein
VTERRFTAPWTAEEYRGISYIIRDANNFPVAYIYFDAKPGTGSAAKTMTKDEVGLRPALPRCLSCSGSSKAPEPARQLTPLKRRDGQKV